LLDGYTTVEEWRQLGVEFVSITQNIDTTTAM
jgi:DNA invertase Pin-like site-specific DNA recombinase